MGQREQAHTAVNLRALALIRGAQHDMTQDQLAEATGIPRSTLANILSPTGEPRLINVTWFTKIAVAVGADPKVWIAELEKVARAERGEDELARRRRTKRTYPKPVSSAARRSEDKPSSPEGR